MTAGESSIEGGYEASERLFSDIHPFTAIAAQSDLMPVGAIRSIGAHGLSTPADISVAASTASTFLGWWAPSPRSTSVARRRAALLRTW
ncbi:MULTISPECIES: hypothetical protein [Dermacoccus]